MALTPTPTATDPLPPPVRQMLAEWPRAAWGVGTLAREWRALVAQVPGDGRPVMLLPGLFNSDRSNIALKRYLNATGYSAQGWGLGRNFGRRTIGADAERLFDAVERRADAAGAPVTLIGVSLGGIMARLAAHRRTPLVRQVVTISSPYMGPARATNVWRAFQIVTGDRIDAPETLALGDEARRPLPVPSAAIWSRSDGLVNGMICHDPADTACRAIEVRSSHLGVQLMPAVLRAVGAVLADTGAAKPAAQ